jgi:hypothetical protein
MRFMTVATTAKSPVDKLKALIGFAKSIDTAALHDLEIIESVTDDHVQPHTQPNTEEVPGGPGQGSRGGQADTQVKNHSDLHPQDGLTRMYAEFNSRMGAMAKSHNTLVKAFKPIAEAFAAMAKAEDEESEKEKAEKAQALAAEKAKADADAVEKAKNDVIAKAVRAAKFAVRKAEDEDDEDEKEKGWEKAVAALKALDAVITKAEDEAQDEKDEERAEKARADLKALRTTVKAAVAAAKKAKDNTAEMRTTGDTKGEAVDKAALETALAEFAKTQNLTITDLMAQFGKGSATGAASPPVFAKALADTSPEDLETRIETAGEQGFLDGDGLMKARSIMGRLKAVKLGFVTMDTVAAEIMAAAPAVRTVFIPVAQAA